MSRPRTTAGKRNIQQQKRERAQAKQERRAARRVAEADTSPTPVTATEGELIEALAKLHGAVEAGEISLHEFEDGRERIRIQLEQVGRLG